MLEITMKKILVAILASFVIFVGCSNTYDSKIKNSEINSSSDSSKNISTYESNSTTIQETTITEIQLTDKQLIEISKYIKDNLDNTEDASISEGVNNYWISIRQSFSTNYVGNYEFAENSIYVCKDVQNKYKLNNTPVIGVTLTSPNDYNNSKYINWSTNNYGETGILTYHSRFQEEVIIQCSLNELSEKLKATDYM